MFPRSHLWKSLVAVTLVGAAAVILTTLPGSRAAENKESGPMFGHMVFFDLKDNTAANRERLVDACYKYLQNLPGVVHFSSGTRAVDYDRAVNDTKFDVSLHVVFKDQASHDAYQTAPNHLQFIKENEELWAGVRVFDSFIKK